MAQDSHRQMLGLSRISSDSAIYIKLHSLVRSIGTEQDPLCLALQYVHHFGTTNSMLCDQYGLRPNTLTDIGKGNVIQRNRGYYLFSLIQELNNLRLRAILKGDAERVMQIVEALAELGLVLGGVATDQELVQADKEKKRK